MGQVEFRNATPLSEITMRAIRRYFLLQLGFGRFQPRHTGRVLLSTICGLHDKRLVPRQAGQVSTVKITKEPSQVTRSRSSMPIDEQLNVLWHVLYCVDVTSIPLFSA